VNAALDAVAEVFVVRVEVIAAATAAGAVYAVATQAAVV